MKLILPSVLNCKRHLPFIIGSLPTVFRQSFSYSSDLQDEECLLQKATLKTNFQKFKALLYAKPVQPENPKQLRVGVVGMPNAGKSTLINTLLGKHLLATSKKIDTTQKNILAILTEGDTQIVFQDTPGIRNKRKSKKITGSFDVSYLPGQCTEEADFCMVVVDLSERKTRQGFLHPEILLHLIKYQHVPSILVLNKIDRLTTKNDVLPLIDLLTAGFVDGIPCKNSSEIQTLKPISLPKIKTEVFKALDTVQNLQSASDISLANKSEALVINQLRNCRGWPHFKEVFVISALKEHNTKKLSRYFRVKALSEPWKYHGDMVTDASPYDIVKGAMRSSLLDNFRGEVPYCVDISVSYWDEANNVLMIGFDLACANMRHESIVASGTNILSFATKRRLEKVFSIDVQVYVSVYCNKNLKIVAR